MRRRALFRSAAALAAISACETFSQGDGVLVFFNDSIPVADHVHSAVRMAVRLRERMDELTAAWRARGHEVGYGMGIAVGEATLGTIGFEGRFDYAAIGGVANLAARLCAQAKSGQILVDDAVRKRVGGVARFAPVGDLALKGFDRPVPAFDVAALS